MIPLRILMIPSRRDFLIRSALVTLSGGGLLASGCGGGGGATRYSYQGYTYQGSLLIADGPRWINYGPKGTLIVGEQWKREIHILSQQGVIQRTIKVPGDAFQYPQECAVSPNGVLHVCDSTANVVRRYRLDGTELSPILSGFGNPTGIEITKNGRIYTIGNLGDDRQRVTVSDLAGNITARLLPPAGSAFNDARGITSDSYNNIYVADFLNARIVKYDATGNHVLTISDVSAFGINVDFQDSLVVTDFFNRRVRVYSGNGAILGEFASSEPGPGNFFEPSTALVMPNGLLYVSDFVINEVSIWKPALAQA